MQELRLQQRQWESFCSSCRELVPHWWFHASMGQRGYPTALHQPGTAFPSYVTIQVAGSSTAGTQAVASASCC